MQQNAPKKEPSTTMIYVSNLPFNTRDEELRQLFKDFEVKTAYVAVRRNGRSKGFGFVNLAKESDQQKALAAVDGKEVEGRKLSAKVAFNDERRNEKGELKEQFKQALPTRKEGPPSDTVVYVSNLPWAYKDEDLKKLFSDLNVKSATVAVRRSGRSKGFGFVEFASKEDQTKGLQHDQKKIEDRVITVKAAVNYRGPGQQPPSGERRERRPRNSRPRRSNNGGGRQGGNGGGRVNVNRNNNSNQGGRPPQSRPENTLYVSNLPFDLEDNDLKSIFSEFNAKNANVASRGGGRSKGFGFVEFTNSQDMKSALEALDQSEVNGRVITIKVSTGRRSSNAPRRGGNFRGERRQGGGGGERRQRPPRSNEKREPSSTMVYVSNLPFSVNDESLAKLFAGQKISKAYVAMRRNGRSKGFGFVDFASSEEQQKALKLNGHEIEGRPLTVQVANKVEAKEASSNNSNNTSK